MTRAPKRKPNGSGGWMTWFHNGGVVKDQGLKGVLSVFSINLWHIQSHILRLERLILQYYRLIREKTKKAGGGSC